MAVNFEALNKMTTEQLRELNEGICTVLRQRQTDRTRSQMACLRVGGKAHFYSEKKGRNVTVRIDRFNTKSVSATELDAHGAETASKWRVHPSLLCPIHA